MSRSVKHVAAMQDMNSHHRATDSRKGKLRARRRFAAGLEVVDDRCHHKASMTIMGSRHINISRRK